MRKLRIVIPIVVSMVAIAAIGFSVVLAQENDNSSASRLAIRVAEILGLDAVAVDDAINQAREEIRDEAVKKKLDSLVEKGKLTQEQADKHRNWMHSKFEGVPPTGKQSFGKKKHHKGWKDYGSLHRHKNDFKGDYSLEEIRMKLNAMIENGNITQEQAASKLKWLQNARSD